MKRLVSLLLVLVFALGSISVVAADNAAEDVLLKVKAKIDIPDELTEFSYSENKYEDVLRYDFTWRTEDYAKELYVSSDSRGRIVTYNYYEDMDYSADRTLIDYTLPDARPLAEAVVEKLFPEYFVADDDRLVLNEESITARYSGRYKTFTFVFDRKYRNCNVESNRVTVRIRATKEKMYVQSINAALDEDAEFIHGEPVFDTLKRQEKYEEKFPIKLYYATDYSGEEPTVKLIYAIDKGYVAYNTGEIITEEWFDRYAGVTEDSAADMGAGGSLMSKNEASLSPKEQSEVDKMTSLVKPEEVEKVLRGLKLLKITDDMVLGESYTYKSDEKYFVRFTLKGEERYMNAVYNGETGEIISIYSYFTKHNESEKEADTDIGVVPEEDIKAFAKVLAGDKLNEADIKFNGENDWATMNAERIVNGVAFPENSINVTYDRKNNMITRYAISWEEDISGFPAPEEAISLESARDILFREGMNDVYLKQKNGYVDAVTIVRGMRIDAVTGEELYVYTSEKKAYEDIKGHWAEEVISILWEHDIYLDGDRFKPDEAIAQADMIRLFSACRDSGIIPIGWTKERIIEYGLEEGYIESEEPDKLMTRREAFRAMAEILGYGDIIDFDIYKSSYSDMTPDGSAEILKALGILLGDIARPADKLTRAEAAVMVYRYLSK